MSNAYGDYQNLLYCYQCRCTYLPGMTLCTRPQCGRVLWSYVEIIHIYAEEYRQQTLQNNIYNNEGS